jgi:serine/threonine-protein kinase
MTDQSTDDRPDRSILSPGGIFAGQYEIVALLGTGGMGAVYKARHLTMDRVVALKVLAPTSELKPERLRRFQREAQLVERLRHPNIVSALSFGATEDGHLYLSMEYIAGPTLQEELKGNGPLSIPRFKTVFAQVCEALSHAHQQNIVHRDLKPSNIIFDQPGSDTVKLLDFGIARAMDDNSTADQRLTQISSGILGTPLYMSPEQCRSSDVDARTDIYSLGCIMYETLCGRTPFTGETPLEIVFAHSSLPPPSFSKAAPHTVIPPWVEPIVMIALSKSPDDRYATADDLLRDLTSERATITPGLRQRPQSLKLKSGKRGWVFWTVACLILTLGIMAATILLYRRDHVAAPVERLSWAQDSKAFTEYNDLHGQVFKPTADRVKHFQLAQRALALLESHRSTTEWTDSTFLRREMITDLRVQCKLKEAEKLAKDSLARLDNNKDFIGKEVYDFCRSELMLSYSRCELNLGKFHDAGAAMSGSLNLHKRDTRESCDLLVEAGDDFFLANDWDAAHTAFLQGYRLGTHCQDYAVQAHCQAMIGSIMSKLNEEGADQHFQQALELAKTSDDPAVLCKTELTIGTAKHQAGKTKEALSYYLKAAKLNGPDQMLAIMSAATLTNGFGNFAEAEKLFKQGLALQKGKLNAVVASTNLQYAEALRTHGDYARMQEYANKALEILDALPPESPDNNPSIRADALVTLGRAQLHDQNKRLEWLRRAEKVMLGCHSPGLGPCLCEQADALIKLNRLDEAQAIAEHAIILMKDYPGIDDNVGKGEIISGDIFAMQKHYEEAAKMYNRALDLRQSTLGANSPSVKDVQLRLNVISKAIKPEGTKK